MSFRDKLLSIASTLATMAGQMETGERTPAATVMDLRKQGEDLALTVRQIEAMENAPWILAGTPWKRVATPPPPTEGALPNFSVSVLAVVLDERYGAEPFVDIVHFWPARPEGEPRWTITHSCQSDEGATDFPVNVVLWKDLDVVPPQGSWLWG
jgi:hypothetical protein